jgi:hypothetical protein
LNATTMGTCQDDREQDALTECYQKGWLHADSFSASADGVAYVFASPLHRWFVERKLYNNPTMPPQSNLLQFSLDVIHQYSPRNLSDRHRIGLGSIQRPPKAQYQDEFYRCCHATVFQTAQPSPFQNLE